MRAEDWAAAQQAARRQVPDRSVDALWRALNYLCAAQLYLRADAALRWPPTAADVKPAPAGHWGTCPPVNLVLAQLGPLARHAPAGADLRVVVGPGHAGPSALAYAHLTGALAERDPGLRPGAAGLGRLVGGFPHAGSLGSEVSPLIPPHAYMGGQLGPALAFAQGTVLDAPHRLTVVLVGDGECETGAAAAAWLGVRALRGTGTHGGVLPVVLLNGLRMGGRSLLGELPPAEQDAYFTGLGYEPVAVDDAAGMRAGLDRALAGLRPVGAPGRPPVLLLRLAKGATGPPAVLGTPAVHKVPLRDPRRDPAELAALVDWLGGYRPGELFTAAGEPAALVAAALPPQPPAAPPPAGPGPSTAGPVTVHSGPPAGGGTVHFGPAMAAVLERHAAAGGFRVFSPDELASNRIPLDRGGRPPWVVEVLNEELCHLWLQGYLETGRRGALVTYEAFAGVNSSLVQQYLKYRRLAAAAGRPDPGSLTYLVTSLGWHNSYSHQNPGLAAAVLDLADPAVRVATPVDARRAAVELDRMLAGTGRCNLLMASKHPLPAYPVDTLAAELARGAAVRPELSAPGRPDLVLAAAGDVPAAQLAAALPAVRAAHPTARLRCVHVHELTVLAGPDRLPQALPPADCAELFGTDCPVLLLVPVRPGAVRGLLATRPGLAARTAVRGYQDPDRPVSGDALARACGLDPPALAALAGRLLRAGVPAEEAVHAHPG